MDPIHGWQAAKQLSVDPNRVPSPDVARVVAKDGSLPLLVGVVLLLVGGVLVLLTFRSPSFDPAGVQRVPITEGSAAVDVAEPGFYVAYVEAPECTGPRTVQFTQAGQPVAQSTPASSQRYSHYGYDGLCASSSGLFSFTAPGTWTTSAFGVSTGNVGVYLEDDPPTRIEPGTLWIAALFLAAGLAVTAKGLVERRRWRRVNEVPTRPR